MNIYNKAVRSFGFFLSLLFLSSSLHAEECSLLQFGLWPSVQLVPKDRNVCGLRLDLLWGDNAEVGGLDVGLVNIGGASKGIQLGGVNGLKSSGGSGSWGVQAAGVMNYMNKITYTGAQTALGLNANMDSKITGLQLAAVNAGGNIDGIQIGIININKNMNLSSVVSGIQVGAGNYVDNMSGIQLAIVNSDEKMNGIQTGFVNSVGSSLSGIEIGFVNGPGDGWGEQLTVAGMQLGLLGNAAGHVTGMQIGLVNICQYLTGAQIGLINIVYGGGGTALPFFPIINVGWH